MKKLIIPIIILSLILPTTVLAKKEKPEPIPTLTEYETGYNDGLICLMLLNIELNYRSKKASWAEMLDTCRQRDNVRRRPVRPTPKK